MGFYVPEVLTVTAAAKSRQFWPNSPLDFWKDYVIVQKILSTTDLRSGTDEGV
jgi:hypothetical protein